MTSKLRKYILLQYIVLDTLFFMDNREKKERKEAKKEKEKRYNLIDMYNWFLKPVKPVEPGFSDLLCQLVKLV